LPVIREDVMDDIDTMVDATAEAIDIDHDGTFGALSWELLEPFGARVHTDRLVDLAWPEQQLLARLLYRHGFVEAKGQDLNKEQFRRVGSFVAPLLPEEHEANPVLAVKAEEGGFGTRALELHRDLSYAEHPFASIALHALRVNPGETSTFIASGVRACGGLPTDLRESLADRKVLTSLHGRVDGELSGDAGRPGWPEWVHPLIAPHPVTGAPVLFVCEMSSVRIEGMEETESERLLKDLFVRVGTEDNVYEHHWYDGDLLIWDNFGCLHARKKLERVSTRTLQRLTMGKLSFPMAFPAFSMRDFTDTTQGQNYMGDGGGRF
jgi:taurine dioxygenase